MNPSQRAYYSRPIPEFLKDDPNYIFGTLSSAHVFDLTEMQRIAWVTQINLLQTQLSEFRSGHIFFEFTIPRMGKRADVVVYLDGIVYVLEFKVGATEYDWASIDQAIDYAVDLVNFHETSHERTVIPVLVATEADEADNSDPTRLQCIKANGGNLGSTLQWAHKSLAQLKDELDAKEWSSGRYKPTPTIIEAAQALYVGHNVADITRNDAGAVNLTSTATCLNQIIEISKRDKLKSICFVTGVPGAGKTLAGLNLACMRKQNADEHAVFLSGNTPLVEVLREALARDEAERLKTSLSKARTKTQTFIQNIHHFRDECLQSTKPPIEKVVVFDEAQRAWEQPYLAKFMAKKKGIQNFSQSEPEFLIGAMDRHEDWCTIICLIGEGQEINSGEAGTIEWLKAISKSFPTWTIWCAPSVVTEHSIESSKCIVEKKAELHLGVSLRSFRSETLSEFIHIVLEGDAIRASSVYNSLKGRFPIYLTRDLNQAKSWLKDVGTGTELKGMLASAGALRLKAHGINVKAKISSVDWFLNPKEDVRSCHFLEDVANEFDVQGLELDWTCVNWDADLRHSLGTWNHWRFMGTKWQRVHKPNDQRYLKNSYRVLLTRARQGMVIFVPLGDLEDRTRNPIYYDGIVEFLQQCGIRTLL